MIFLNEMFMYLCIYLSLCIECPPSDPVATTSSSCIAVHTSKSSKKKNKNCTTNKNSTMSLLHLKKVFQVDFFLLKLRLSPIQLLAITLLALLFFSFYYGNDT